MNTLAATTLRTRALAAEASDSASRIIRRAAKPATVPTPHTRPTLRRILPAAAVAQMCSDDSEEA